MWSVVVIDGVPMPQKDPHGNLETRTDAEYVARKMIAIDNRLVKACAMCDGYRPKDDYLCRRCRSLWETGEWL